MATDHHIRSRRSNRSKSKPAALRNACDPYTQNSKLNIQALRLRRATARPPRPSKVTEDGSGTVTTREAKSR